MARLTNIDLVNQVDSFPYQDVDDWATQSRTLDIYMLVSKDAEGTVPQGYMLSSVVKTLMGVPIDIRGEVAVDEDSRTVLAFTDSSEPERTARIERTFGYIKDQKVFSCLNSWKGEMSPVYDRDNSTVLYSVDRAVTELLGVMRWGVHMTAYVVDPTAPRGLRIWVPKRAANKSYPGMLDNTAAGGLKTGEDPLDGIVREAMEEASLPEPLARERTQLTSSVTYMHVSEAADGAAVGMIHPECHRIFDIEVPAHFTPIPREGEVAEYRLCTVPEVQEDLAMGRFKPNCALIMLEFFIRHGVYTEENEPRFAEIKKRLHRKLPLAGPHRL